MDLGIGEVALIAAAGTAVSAGVAAYSSREEGIAVARSDRAKARIASEQATQQQIGMRQNLLRALATQNAQAAAGGGSISTANAMRQITQAQNDLMISRAGASAQVSLLDQAGRDATAAGNLGAANDLVSGAAAVAKNWPGSGAPPVAPATTTAASNSP